MKQTFVAGVLGVLIWAGVLADAGAGTRVIPRPLPSHPGNIFLTGETVTVPAPPAGEGDTWQAVDYEGRIVAEGRVTGGPIDLGRLPVGYYEIRRSAAGATNRLSVGVLEGLRAPTPLSSPIGIDVAMAWFYPKDKMGSVANLCALAGINRVRDRLSWPELEPRKGEFAATDRYDWSAQTQAAAGLQVLQVDHLSPAWANPNGKRFPLDLRDTYNFHRAMARRWQGEVVAFEPWNEADIPMFGGHTGSEMASLQKAAYLGLKAGNPKVIACLNVFALHRAATLRDLHENEAWPCFDTFNLHHYEAFNAYPRLYADFRAVSAGKPLWVTECSVPVKWHGDERLQEPTDEDLRVQSERMAMTFAQAIHEGAQAVYYFILPHFVEGQTQFGVLRPDLTPRPAFVALAAAGRLLADAEPLGQVKDGSNSIHAFLFRARPDGQSADVLVAWSKSEVEFELPKPPKACFDHLGRTREVTGKVLNLSRAPLIAVLDRGTRLSLVPPPEPAKLEPGKPSLVVMQAVMPEASIVLEKSAYKVPAGQTTTIPIFLYNFGAKAARGRLSTPMSFNSTRPLVSPPWEAELPREVEVAPGERKELALRLTGVSTNGVEAAAIRITGEFGSAGRTVLSLNLVPGVN
ncbi:MAG: hypothetical protein ACLQU3_15310 [Limisphaerales bacterium]